LYKKNDHVTQELEYDGTRFPIKPACLFFFQEERVKGNDNPLVSTIIVSHNSIKYIGECLDSISKQVYQNHEIIVVDNGSTDGTPQYIRELYPNIICIALQDNKEYVKANNLGLKNAKGEFIAILNPDTSVSEDFITRMVEILRSNARVGGIACTINTRGSQVRYAPVFFTMNGLIQGQRLQLKTPIFCLAPCGAAAMYKRSVIEQQYEFLDEDFVLDWEDHDLGYRVNLSGYWCVYDPSIIVNHIGSAAYGRSIKRDIRIYRNMLLT
jgi:GT2 family glycosyltransferase